MDRIDEAFARGNRLYAAGDTDGAIRAYVEYITLDMERARDEADALYTEADRLYLEGDGLRIGGNPPEANRRYAEADRMYAEANLIYEQLNRSTDPLPTALRSPTHPG